jgi:hypothetical protein
MPLAARISMCADPSVRLPLRLGWRTPIIV